MYAVYQDENFTSINKNLRHFFNEEKHKQTIKPGREVQCFKDFKIVNLSITCFVGSMVCDKRYCE